MGAFAVVGLWSAGAFAAGLVWTSQPARAQEAQPHGPPSAMSSEQMQQARRELAEGLTERAQKVAEDDWPSGTGSVPGRPAPAPLVEDLSGQGIERLMFDRNPLGRPQDLTPSQQKQETEESDISIPLPPPVPVLVTPAATRSPPDAPSQTASPPAPPRTKTGAAAHPREERGERAVKPAKTVHKAEARGRKRKKAVQVAFYKRGAAAPRSYRMRSARPVSIAGVVGAAGHGIRTVGRRIGFALSCLTHSRCRTPRQVAGTVVGAAAGGALGGTGGGIAGGVIGAVASAPHR
jgi:hypothetical protein